MLNIRARFATTILLIGALATVPTISAAASASEHRVVNGISIYLGIVPAEIVHGQPGQFPESDMHGGPSGGEHTYHLMIALFDSKTGARISNAQVGASVSEINHPGHQRKLEPMLIAGTIAYGNYFDLPGSGPYRIVVQIRHPSQPRVIEAEFLFKHARA